MAWKEMRDAEIALASASYRFQKLVKETELIRATSNGLCMKCYAKLSMQNTSGLCAEHETIRHMRYGSDLRRHKRHRAKLAAAGAAKES